MGHTGRTGRARLRGALLALALAFTGGACASGDDDDVAVPAPLDGETTSAPGSTTAPPCSQSRHTIVFDFLGTLTTERDFVTAIGLELEVPARPGAADVVTAYHERGYEVLYVSTAPGSAPVGDSTFVDALTVWLGRNGFPVDDRTRVWTWNEGEDPIVALLEELLRVEQAGVSVDAGYTDDPDKTNAMTSGGVPPDAMWTLGEAAQAAGSPATTAVPGDDFVAHVATVERLGMVCRPD